MAYFTLEVRPTNLVWPEQGLMISSMSRINWQSNCDYCGSKAVDVYYSIMAGDYSVIIIQ